MTDTIVATILTGVGVTGAVLLGVWRILAHFETRNDLAHADLGRRIDAGDLKLGQRIDNLRTELGGRIDRTNERIDKTTDQVEGVGTELGASIAGMKELLRSGSGGACGAPERGAETARAASAARWTPSRSSWAQAG